MIFQVKQMR